MGGIRGPVMMALRTFIKNLIIRLVIKSLSKQFRAKHFIQFAHWIEAENRIFFEYFLPFKYFAHVWLTVPVLWHILPSSFFWLYPPQHSWVRPSDVLELSFLLGPALVWVKRQEGRPVAGSCSRKKVQLWNKMNIFIKLLLKLVCNLVDHLAVT